MEIKVSHQFEGKIVNSGKLNITFQNVRIVTEETTKKVIVTFALNEKYNEKIEQIAELPVILDITSQGQIEIDPCVRRAIALIKDQFVDLVQTRLQNTDTISIYLILPKQTGRML